MCAENHGLMMQGNEVTEVMPGVPPVVSPSVSLPDAAVPLGGGMRAEAKARAERKMSLVQLRDNPLVQEMADRAALEMVSSSLLDMQKAGKIDVLRAVAVLRVGALSFHRTASAQIRQYCEVLGTLIGVDWRTVLEEEEAAAARRQDPISEAEFISAQGEVNALVQPWEARGVPIAYTISVKGEVRVYFNECFVNGYLRDATQVKEFSSPNVVPLLLWRRVIVPEDQLFFFTAMTSCIVSQEGPPGSREVAVLVRCFQYDGAEVLSEVRYRVLYSTHGFAQAFSIHPLTFDETLAEEEKRRREAANPTPTFRVYTPS
ncbi:hypothetical protein Naga_100408g3 [Nannochloropsis gaditana]|uniref:Uncharacterized protein n=1 Tax=Nannochloropsis gaditana TaxID=72520 RepID=W7TTY1_9STRA|nr:hypothetical protein Naga_100408g3 [Nannochloropsis gaditana]